MSVVEIIAAPTLQMLVAIGCGAALGAEREVRRHCAGLRTMILISLGSCLFVMAAASIVAAEYQNDHIRIDPGRIPSYVIAGIGFLGAGPIIHRGRTAAGLTTAATIWTAASLGILSGLERYDLVAIATITILVVLRAFNPLSNYLSGGVHRGSLRLRCPAEEVTLQHLCHALSATGALDEMRIDRRPDFFAVRIWYRGTDSNLEELFGIIGEMKQVSADPDDQQDHAPSTSRWRSDDPPEIATRRAAGESR
jgi:uncharacterized membrane protein YhiD involved in acid resistance